jgi:hypothetical protein
LVESAEEEIPWRGRLEWKRRHFAMGMEVGRRVDSVDGTVCGVVCKEGGDMVQEEIFERSRRSLLGVRKGSIV